MKKVRIDYKNGGYAIYVFDVNRYYSKIAKNNEYIPVVFKTKEEVLEICKEMKYRILNKQF